MSAKGNGTGKGNGQDKEGNIVRMPSLAERDRLRREKEKAWRRQYRKEKKAQSVPFFNAGRIPPLTRMMIAVFVIVHLPLYIFLDAGQRLTVFYTFGFVPAYYTGAEQWIWFALTAPLTHIFIHGNWMHLLFNTVMMLVMGMFVESLFGARRMLIFFLLCGFAGALVYFIFNPFLDQPVIGASGSISGLFAMTILYMSERNMLGPLGGRGPFPLLLLWIALITGMGLLAGDVAWQAHLGGFLAGIGLYYGIKKGLVRFLALRAACRPVGIPPLKTRRPLPGNPRQLC